VCVYVLKGGYLLWSKLPLSDALLLLNMTVTASNIQSYFHTLSFMYLIVLLLSYNSRHRQGEAAVAQEVHSAGDLQARAWVSYMLCAVCPCVSGVLLYFVLVILFWFLLCVMFIIYRQWRRYIVYKTHK